MSWAGSRRAGMCPTCRWFSGKTRCGGGWCQRQAAKKQQDGDAIAAPRDTSIGLKQDVLVEGFLPRWLGCMEIRRNNRLEVESSVWVEVAAQLVSPPLLHVN